MARGLIVRVKNNTGSTLLVNKAVYITGFDEDSQTPTVGLASANNNAKLPAIGLIREDIVNGGSGSVRINGLVGGINTSNEQVNSEVYVGLNGALVFSEPTTFTAQQVGAVVTVEENGQIFLFPMELRRVSLHAATHQPDAVDDLELEHADLLEISANQHHNQLHASSHSPSGSDPVDGTYLPRDGSVGMTGSLGVGTNSPAPSAALEISSTSQGLLISPMTATQASAIGSPANGLIVYVSNTNGTFTSIGFWGRQAGSWVKL